ncbi:hypothetical protein DL769_006557 [Monosporascus sp. CRB-8-3]|nr:hypothetical protein DL769_006557 [Monosporascus sp. CRB-8-3]
MIASTGPRHFFSIYLAVFMFLHETSLIPPAGTDGRDNGLEEPYSLPDQVEAVQEGASIILSHWHYYNRGFEPLRADWEKGEKAICAQLKTKERELSLLPRKSFIYGAPPRATVMENHRGHNTDFQ